MSELPNSNYDKIRIYPNEYVTNGTINRGARRLLENDLWIENHISGAISASSIITALSGDVKAVEIQTESVYSTVASNSGHWGEASQGDVEGPATNHNSYVPQWNGANSKVLADGLPVGNGAGSLVARPSVNTLATDSLQPITTNGAVTVNGLPFKNAAPYLGSDAVGDLWFRGGLGMSRLPLGTNGQVLTVSSVTSQPVWAGLPLLTSVYSTVHSNSGSWTLQGNTFNGVNQLVKTTSSGALPALSGSNLTALNGTNITTGTVAAARGGAGAISGIMKANGSGVVSAAVSKVDYAPATTGTSSQLVGSDGSGGLTNVTVGNNLNYSGGILSSNAGATTYSAVTSGFTQTTTGYEYHFTSSTTANRTVVLMSPPAVNSSPSVFFNDSTFFITLSGSMIDSAGTRATAVLAPGDQVKLVSDGTYWHVFLNPRIPYPAAYSDSNHYSPVALYSTTVGGADSSASLLFHFDSATSNNGTSTATISPVGTPSYVSSPMAAGMAASLDGSWTVSIGSSSDLAIGTSDFCLEFNITPYADGGNQGNIFTSTSLNIYLDSGTSSRTLRVNFGGDNQGGQSLTVGTNYYVAITRTGGYRRHWINGVNTESWSNSTNITSSTGLTIGGSHTLGILDEMRLTIGVYTATSHMLQTQLLREIC